MKRKDILISQMDNKVVMCSENFRENKKLILEKFKKNICLECQNTERGGESIFNLFCQYLTFLIK